MFVFLFAEQITRIGKGWYPLAIDQMGIPADMIDVQMRAQDEVDVLALHPCRG